MWNIIFCAEKKETRGKRVESQGPKVKDVSRQSLAAQKKSCNGIYETFATHEIPKAPKG